MKPYSAERLELITNRINEFLSEAMEEENQKQIETLKETAYVLKEAFDQVFNDWIKTI